MHSTLSQGRHTCSIRMLYSCFRINVALTMSHSHAFALTLSRKPLSKFNLHHKRKWWGHKFNHFTFKSLSFWLAHDKKDHRKQSLCFAIHLQLFQDLAECAKIWELYPIFFAISFMLRIPVTTLFADLLLLFAFTFPLRKLCRDENFVKMPRKYSICYRTYKVVHHIQAFELETVAHHTTPES